MPTRPGLHRPNFGKPRHIAEHERRAAIDAQRPTSAERGYDAAWRRCRKLFLAKHPACVSCAMPATDVDHVISIRDRPDLRLSWSNLRPYCHRHHSRRTATEQGFARPT
jgi:5-methylcytosine-specific restriction enzyme A